MARLSLVFASVVMSVSAFYGGYGPYGGADVMAAEPITDMDVLAVGMPAPAPAPIIDVDVLPINERPGQTSTQFGCLIDHGNGCEQCEPGFYKVGTAEAPSCAPCDFEGCNFCNDFVGCGQCDPGFFIMPGNPEDQAAMCGSCDGDQEEAANFGCQT